MSCLRKSAGVIAICLSAYLPFGAAAFSQNVAPQPGDGCKAPAVQQSPNKSGALPQGSDITGSTTLSNCNGVLKPPETGDGSLVQPAPPASNMPVVNPNDLPAQQQNAK